jgi:hypothetical protein
MLPDAFPPGLQHAAGSLRTLRADVGIFRTGENPRLFANGAMLYQPSSHVSGGGDVTVSRYSLTAGSAIPVNEPVEKPLTAS